VHAGEGALPELAGWFILLQFAQNGGEDVSRNQGQGVVVAQDPAAAGEGVLGELASRLILPRLPQNGREDGCRGLVVAWQSLSNLSHAYPCVYGLSSKYERKHINAFSSR
jgi:hypothetical protein